MQKELAYSSHRKILSENHKRRMDKKKKDNILKARCLGL